MLRLGIIGKPSDWLIASTYDKETVAQTFGFELVDIPIEEVTSLGKVDGGKEGAEVIYERLKSIIAKYDLAGLTLRCFDLLTTVYNTGCWALAKLNSEGIPAACEGDVPTLITMMIAKQISGCPGFQANPARIDYPTAEGGLSVEDGLSGEAGVSESPERPAKRSSKMLFAHCTLPLSMCERYSLTTHFESGIGVAIHGELPLGDYTLMKVNGDGSRVFAEDVKLIRNQYEPNLCRTQVWLEVSEEAVKYFLTHPIANHHVILPCHWAAFLQKMQKDLHI